MGLPADMQHTHPSALDAARDYLRRGWCVVPLPYKQKKPVIEAWEQLRLQEIDLPTYFEQPANIGLILGAPSGGLVDVDLDCVEARAIAAQYLPATPAKTGRTGAADSHWWYYAADTQTQQHRDSRTRKMIVELRSTGGQTVVGPSIHPSGEPYEVLSGEPAVVPGPMLAACVAALAKRVIEIRYGSSEEPRRSAVPAPTDRPQFQMPADREHRALAYLEKMPPAISGAGGHSATYAAATALVHGFEIDPERALVLLCEHYNPRCEPPWSEKELRHKVEDAATKPHDRPRGWLLTENSVPTPDPVVDISAIVGAVAGVATTPSVAAAAEPEEPLVADPGPVPDELLAMPGFVDDVMRFTLDTAPYPNRRLAFLGAVALLGALTGRKVREPGNVRTNVQILALASSGVGKDWPRKVNASILLHAGEARKFSGKSSSGEGIEDRLARHPVMLKQDDEIDTLFENIRDNKEARYRNQFGMLLELYGEAGGWRAIRDKAGCESQIIHQPHLVLFGTTTPGEFYDSLSGKMLNKGLLARLIAIEAGERGPRRRARWSDPPEQLVRAAQVWAEFRPPGWGNLSDESTGQATPIVVPIADNALRALDAFADECDASYHAAAKLTNEPVMAIWARAVEKATQLALIYACSAHGTQPVIEVPAVNWASAFIRHTVQRTIFRLGQRFHESEFEQKCQRVLESLTDWQRQHAGEWMPYRDLARRHRWPRRDHDSVREALADQELIDTDVLKTGGRPRLVYRLRTRAAGNTG